MEVAFENAYILIHEKKISSRTDLLPLLEQISNVGKPLLIVAEDVESEVLASLVVNKLRGPLQVAAVRAPGRGAQLKGMLQEMALLTGGKAITADLDVQLKDMQMSDLGQAKKIIIGKNITLVEAIACA
jgi:chaperonin GroEL